MILAINSVGAYGQSVMVAQCNIMAVNLVWTLTINITCTSTLAGNELRSFHIIVNRLSAKIGHMLLQCKL